MKNGGVYMYTCLHPNKASWKFWKMGVYTCIRVYIQIKPHENFEKQGGVYVYTCIHPNKIKIESFELVYYGNI